MAVQFVPESVLTVGLYRERQSDVLRPLPLAALDVWGERLHPPMQRLLSRTILQRIGHYPIWLIDVYIWSGTVLSTLLPILFTVLAHAVHQQLVLFVGPFAARTLASHMGACMILARDVPLEQFDVETALISHQTLCRSSVRVEVLRHFLPVRGFVLRRELQQLFVFVFGPRTCTKFG